MRLAHSMRHAVSVGLLSWVGCGIAAAAALPDAQADRTPLFMDGPRIMILYDPSLARVPVTAELVERELRARFTAKELNVVDPGTARGLRREASALLRFESVDNVATRLSLGHNADALVIYRLALTPTGADGVLEQGRSTIPGRAIVTATSRLLATATETATGVGETLELAVADATVKASAAFGDSLSSAIAKWWTAFLKDGIPCTVVLESDPRERLEPRFTARLAGLRGIVFLNLRACGGEFCEYQVLYRGTTARLRQRLIRALIREPGFERLATSSMRGNSLLFSVK